MKPQPMINARIVPLTPAGLQRPEPVERGTRARCVRPAFSIIELLVVIGIVIIVLGIVVVAVSSATRMAQRANTQSLMNSLRQGLTQFENEMGYLPPVLNHRRDIRFTEFDDRMNGPAPLPSGASAMLRESFQQWYSVTTLAEYLIGYGTESEVGHNGLGIRNPGSDGYWGATQDHGCITGIRGTIQYRRSFLNASGGCSDVSARYRSGQVYGPYLELRDDRLLGAIDPDNLWVNEDRNQFRVLFPGDADYNDDLPKVIIDHWGQPIHYYRLPYISASDPGRLYRARPQSPTFRVPTLSDFFALRPYRTRHAEAVDGLPDLDGNPSTTIPLQTAKFGLLSAGPDQSLTREVSVDEEWPSGVPRDFNVDNIVEVGP